MAHNGLRVCEGLNVLAHFRLRATTDFCKHDDGRSAQAFANGVRTQTDGKNRCKEARSALHRKAKRIFAIVLQIHAVSVELREAK